MTPLEEICPTLPARFASTLERMRERGVPFTLASIQPPLSELREELLREVDSMHAPCGEHAHAYARYVVITEWMLRCMVLTGESQLIHLIDAQQGTQVRACRLPADLVAFDESARMVLATQRALQILSERLFGGRPFLLASEQKRLDELAAAVNERIARELTTLSVECGALVRDGVDDAARALADQKAERAQRRTRAALGSKAPAHPALVVN